jgi:elongation factor P
VLGHTDLKKDTLIELDGAPYRVTDYSHHAMGRGGAVVQVKLKNLLTGSVTEKSFRSADKIRPADIARLSMQFLYRDDDNLNFMDQTTFEQEVVPASLLGDVVKYLAEGQLAQLLKHGERIIGAELPNNVYLKVTYTEPGVKGDTVSTTLKESTVETGARVMVPLFVNEGDVIKVDTRTGAYLERQK